MLSFVSWYGGGCDIKFTICFAISNGRGEIGCRDSIPGESTLVEIGVNVWPASPGARKDRLRRTLLLTAAAAANRRIRLIDI